MSNRVWWTITVVALLVASVCIGQLGVAVASPQASGIDEFGSLITATSATSTQASADQTNDGARGVTCMIDLTSHNGASLLPGVQWKDPASGNYFPLILSSTAMTTTGQVTFSVYPGMTASAPVAYGSTNSIAVSMALPRTWRARVVHNNSNAATYTVGCSTTI